MAVLGGEGFKTHISLQSFAEEVDDKAVLDIFFFGGGERGEG